MPRNESSLDTIQDIAGYALIAYLLSNGLWNEKITEDTKPVQAFFNSVVSLFEGKLRDYGLRDIEKVGMGGVASRLVDKVERLRSLLGQEQYPLQVLAQGGSNIEAPKKNGDVGYDLITREDTIIPPRASAAVDVETGVQIKLPSGFWGIVINRSSTPRKRGLMVMPGVIDQGYTGPLYACVWNMTEKEVEVKKGEKLAQVIMLPAYTRPIDLVDALPQTDRGATGFGSTDGLK